MKTQIKKRDIFKNILLQILLFVLFYLMLYGLYTNNNTIMVSVLLIVGISLSHIIIISDNNYINQRRYYRKASNIIGVISIASLLLLYYDVSPIVSVFLYIISLIYLKKGSSITIPTNIYNSISEMNYYQSLVISEILYSIVDFDSDALVEVRKFTDDNLSIKDIESLYLSLDGLLNMYTDYLNINLSDNELELEFVYNSKESKLKCVNFIKNQLNKEFKKLKI